jgi:hypothetical protein
MAERLLAAELTSSGQRVGAAEPDGRHVIDVTL